MIPKASKDGWEEEEGSDEVAVLEMEASPYLMRTGVRRCGCCWSFRELSGCSTRPSTAAQMSILRARPGMAAGSGGGCRV